MEGTPRIESVEGMDWRNLKAEAFQKSESLIAKIEGFDGMDANQKVTALDTTLTNLERGGNANRFVAQEIARQQGILLEEARHRTEMERYGVTV